MNTAQASLFVTELANQLSTVFTLNGEAINPNDLGADNGLLPLVVIKMNESLGALYASQTSHLNYIQKTNNQEFFLGCKVKGFPDIPDSEIHLHLTQGLMALGRAPSPKLHLPLDMSQAGLLATSELSTHIAQYKELLTPSLHAFAQKRKENNENAPG